MIGKILNNRYEIIEKIGEGGMAIVYKAKCHLLNRFVAIKVLRDEFTEDEQFIGKFRRESQAAASLSHPNILNIYDVGTEEVDNKKVHYIVMEYINGITLKEVIRNKGKLPADDVIRYSLQIAEALDHAHKNHIVHRDIKPHNIMITKDNRIKVTDFGIARAVTSSTVTTTSNVLGSVHYFSPEQARGGYTDEKSDIYSLGIVMYEMITGKVPYDGESPITVALKHIQEDIIPPSKLDINIPSNLENIIMKCVQKRQSDRYNNISELISDLKNIKSIDIKPLIDDDMESATRIIPAIDIKEDDIMESKSERSKKNINHKKKKSKKDGGGVVFLGILLAFVLVTSLFLGYAKLKEFLSIDEVIVPNIVGMKEDEARAKIEGLNLAFNVVDRVKNDEFEAGEVIHQSVEPNTTVKTGYPINVTISEGPDLVSVPPILNKTLAEAEEILKNSGLRIGTIDPGFSETVPKGSIMEQKPEPFTELAPGSRINIVISEGPEIVNVQMPNVVNKPIEEAKSMIIAAGLEVGDITPQPSNNVPKELVTWQSYEPGTTLESGTSVDLYISSGPEEINEPGNNEPGDNSDVEVPTTFTLTPFPDKEDTEIKIIRVQDGETKVVFHETRKLSDGIFTITLYGKVGARYDIFFDDIFQGSQTSVAP